MRVTYRCPCLICEPKCFAFESRGPRWARCIEKADLRLRALGTLVPNCASRLTSWPTARSLTQGALEEQFPRLEKLLEELLGRDVSLGRVVAAWPTGVPSITYAGAEPEE